MSEWTTIASRCWWWETGRPSSPSFGTLGSPWSRWTLKAVLLGPDSDLPMIPMIAEAANSRSCPAATR